MGTNRALVVLVCAYVTLLTVTSQAYDCRSPPSPTPSYFLSFGEQVGDEVLEQKSAQLKLNVMFPFLQGSYDKLYVNADGVISFLRPFTRATPTRLPLTGTSRVPMLAPYWSDIDLSANNGQVYYRQSTSPHTLNQAYALMQRYSPEVTSGVVADFRPSLVVIVTWQNVTFGGGSCTTPVNSFQAVMLTNGRHSFAFYLYGDMAWTSSRLSGGNIRGLGGSPALVGYASGRVDNNLMVNCSLRACIRTAVTVESNTRTDSTWVFRLENNTIQNYGCMRSGPATITNGVGPVLGGKPFQLTGPCLSHVGNHDIRCRMGDADMTGTREYDSNNNLYMIQCIPPLSLRAGTVTVGLSIDRGRTYPFTANYTYVLDDPWFKLTQVDEPNWDIATNQGILTWDTAALPATYINIEFFIIFPGDSPDKVTTAGVELLSIDTRNRPGYAKLPIGLSRITTMPTLTSFGSLRIYDHHKQNSSDKVILYSTPQWSLFFFNQWVIELAYRTLRRVPFGTTAESDRDWSHLEPHLSTPEAKQYLGAYPTRETLARYMAEGRLDNFTKSFFGRLCGKWKAADVANPQQLKAALPKVPCNLDELSRDDWFKPDFTCGLDNRQRVRCRYRPEAVLCVIADAPTSQGYGQRACYDTSSQLITSSSDRQSAGNSQWYYRDRWFANKFYDERGQAHCCVYSDNCKTWSERRPASTCRGRSDMTTPPLNDNQGTSAPSLLIDPTKGPIMGGNPITITLPSPALSAICRIGKVLVNAVISSGTKAQCIAPLSYATTAVPVRVSVDGGRTFLPETSSYKYDPRDRSYTLGRGDLKIWEDVKQRPSIMWDMTVFNPSYVNIDFVEFFPGREPNSAPVQEAVPVLISSPTLQQQVKMPLGLRYITTMPTLTTFGALRLYDSSQQHQASKRKTLWSDPFWSLWFFNQYLVELIYRQSTSTPVQMTAEATSIWTSLRPLLSGTFIRSRDDAARFIASGKLSSWKIATYNALCGEWAANEAKDPPNFSDLPVVPCTPDKAAKDAMYYMDPMCQTQKPCIFRPGADVCFVTNNPSPKLHAQRVCYDTAGNLIVNTGNVSAGSSIRWFPAVDWFQNQFYDQRGHMHCCVWGRSCDKFSRYRPARGCKGYAPGKTVLGSSAFSAGSLVGLMLAGAMAGFIAAFLIACLGLPRKRDSKQKTTHNQNNINRPVAIPMTTRPKQKKEKKQKSEKKVKKQKTQKPAKTSPKAAKPAKIRKPKRGRRHETAENVYVEPEPYPYVNNKRRSRESGNNRSSGAPREAEYMDFNEEDEYYNDGNIGNNNRDSHFSNPIASVDSMYAESTNSRKRDSRISNQSSSSRRSDNSKRSNRSSNSHRSNQYRPPSNRDRISEESGEYDNRSSGERARHNSGSDDYYNDRDYGSNPGTDNMMF